MLLKESQSANATTSVSFLCPVADVAAQTKQHASAALVVSQQALHGRDPGSASLPLRTAARKILWRLQPAEVGA